jgi:hypothetical protein
MTANHDDAEFADIDSCITSQLHEAAAALTAGTDMQARLHAVFRAAAQDDEHDGETGINRRK